MKPEDIGTIPIGDFRRFLHQNDWEIVPHPNDRIQVFKQKGESAKYNSLLLPASEDLVDGTLIVSEAIKILSDILGLSGKALIQKISGSVRDVLRARLFQLVGSENSLPLDIASKVITNLQQFIGCSAYTEYDPRPAFDRVGNASKEFIHHCQFGHTFQGSFGITIESPIEVQTTIPPNSPPILPALIDFQPPIIPFERKVFERIAIGFNVLRSSMETDSLEPLLKSYKTGLNANMCRALCQTYEAVDERRIEYDFSWSTGLPTDLDLDWKPMTFDGRAFELSNAAAIELQRTEETPEAPALIKGKVFELKSEIPPGLDERQEYEHVITMLWKRENGGEVNLRIPLPPTQYIRACDAHKYGQDVSIYGIPEKSGMYWILTKGQRFDVHP